MMESPDISISAGAGGTAWRNNLLYYVAIPLFVGLLINWKVFFFPDYYAFEANDEVAHTFTEINLVWKMLQQGQLPLINLFNNFGTPLLGDPVVNPFAVQALTYLFFSTYLAASINRFVMIALSVSLLTFYYHKYCSFSFLISSICAILVVMLPIFGWFSVNHPHQGVILYFVLVLIFQQRFAQNQNWPCLLLLYLALIIFVLSVGLNGLFFAIPFFLANYFI